MSTLRVAAIQLETRPGDIEGNLAALGQAVRNAAAAGAGLVVAPEAAVTGYCFDSFDEAVPVAQAATRVVSEALSHLAADTGAHVIAGSIAYRDGALHNEAVIAAADGRVWTYAKAHLPFLGVDRFVSPGPLPPPVIDLGAVRVGVLICYDLRFPEAARVCALAGADLIAIPTAWPIGAEYHPDLFLPARAAENHCYVVAADRVGTERGVTFIGRSRVIDYNGRCLAEASGSEPEILTAEIDPERARETHVVVRRGEYEWDAIRDRRPGLYGRIGDTGGSAR